MALFKKKEKNEDITVKDALELVHEPNREDVESELVKTSLVIHPDWDLSSQEKYVYMYKHQELPLLKPNQISIKGIKLLQFDDGFVVVALLRNTLAKAIRFESVDLLLLDENGVALAKRQFELDGLGEMPPMSCMPWRFLYHNEDKITDAPLPKEGWSIAFELKQSAMGPNQLDLEESWEKELSPVQKDQLEKLIPTLPPLGPSEVNIMGLEVKLLDNGNLVSTVLIRNGSNKELQFEKLPLVIEDATGEKIAQGSFTLQNFKVKANTTKPWTFIFPKELITKENPDLSKWKVHPPEKTE
jgi:accessory Sec system S-layer assembly protein